MKEKWRQTNKVVLCQIDCLNFSQSSFDFIIIIVALKANNLFNKEQVRHSIYLLQVAYPNLVQCKWQIVCRKYIYNHIFLEHNTCWTLLVWRDEYKLWKCTTNRIGLEMVAIQISPTVFFDFGDLHWTYESSLWMYHYTEECHRKYVANVAKRHLWTNKRLGTECQPKCYAYFCNRQTQKGMGKSLTTARY